MKLNEWLQNPRDEDEADRYVEMAAAEIRERWSESERRKRSIICDRRVDIRVIPTHGMIRNSEVM